MTVTWVVGANGLLGGAVRRELESGSSDDVLVHGVRWGTSEASPDLSAGIDRLFALSGNSPWRVLWCAGSAVTAAKQEDLDRETAVFERFLDDLASRQARSRSTGTLFFASSAGGVYGGSIHGPFTEATAPNSLGPYGTSKLQAERAVRAFSERSGVPSLVGRIANLYGPGQSLAKSQGLISQLCLAVLLAKPISIYVPLDTRRDYLFNADCAAMVVAASDRLARVEEGDLAHTKIFASGRSVTVGSVLGEFKQVAGKKLKVIMGNSSAASEQGRDIRLRSTHWTDLDEREMVTLVDGMSRTLGQLRRSFAVGGGAALS